MRNVVKRMSKSAHQWSGTASEFEMKFNFLMQFDINERMIQRLQFRTLVKKYGVDLCFTPMIMTDSFCQSEKARQNEFSTNCDDTPLIAQFAANNVHEYLSSMEMVYPYVDGVDLNCGCPQRWAMQSGYGSALLNKPELIQDLTSTIKRNVSESFSISVKLRVQHTLR